MSRWRTPFPTSFQFTPLREGRPQSAALIAVCSEFQFTPLREGRQAHGQGEWRYVVFQFTPLREGRHAGRIHPRQTVHISIHAPPRGATNARDVVVCFKLISIHAPPRGATEIAAMLDEIRKISIHAPPRGATGNGSQPSDSHPFQFTPLREGRRLSMRGKARI